MSSSSRRSGSGTPADRPTEHALALLDELAADLRAGRKAAVRVMFADEESYSLLVEASYEGAPDDVVASQDQCPRCGSTRLADGGAGDRLCVACQHVFAAPPRATP